MKNKLINLRNFVMYYITGATAGMPDGPEAGNIQPQWMQELPQLKENMFMAVNALLLSKKNDRLIKRHVRQAQRECISLLDSLPAARPPDLPTNNLQEATKACLEELLHYLHAAHENYFDTETNAPQMQVIAVQMIVEEKMNMLKAVLKRKKVNHVLQDLICNAFDRFTQLPQASYQLLHYMERLQASMIKLCNQVENAVFDELLIEHLWYFGFNESAFVLYCKRRIDHALTELFLPAAQYEKLCYFEKLLMAQQEKAGFQFAAHRASVKAQLLAFVRAELHYVQQKNNFGQQKALPAHGKDNAIEDYRVKVNLSADGLAYLLRLLCETNIIDARPRTHLMNFMARSFQTAGIGEVQLSPSSLGTKYKQVTQSTATGIKALLNRMVKQVEADFGKP